MLHALIESLDTAIQTQDRVPVSVSRRRRKHRTRRASITGGFVQRLRRRHAPATFIVRILVGTDWQP